MAYSFTARWLEGADNNAPDALAIRDTHSGDSESLRLQEFRKYAEQDEEYQLLRIFVLNGFPKQRKQLPESCRRYWNIHQQLTLDDGLIVYSCRLLIPSKMSLHTCTKPIKEHLEPSNVLV